MNRSCGEQTLLKLMDLHPDCVDLGVDVFRYIFPFLAVFVTTTNILIVFVFMKPHIRSHTTFILTLIACADILGIVCPTVVFAYLYLFGYYKEYLTCKQIEWTYILGEICVDVFNMLSLWLTVLLAYIRCRCINSPFLARHVHSFKRVFIYLICLLILVISLHVPSFYIFEFQQVQYVDKDNNGTHAVCAMLEPDGVFLKSCSSRKVQLILETVFDSVLPCVLLVYCTFAMLCTLHRGKQNRLSLRKIDSVRYNSIKESKKYAKEELTEQTCALRCEEAIAKCEKTDCESSRVKYKRNNCEEKREGNVCDANNENWDTTDVEVNNATCDREDHEVVKAKRGNIDIAAKTVKCESINCASCDKTICKAIDLDNTKDDIFKGDEEHISSFSKDANKDNNNDTVFFDSDENNDEKKSLDVDVSLFCSCLNCQNSATKTVRQSTSSDSTIDKLDRESRRTSWLILCVSTIVLVHEFPLVAINIYNLTTYKDKPLPLSNGCLSIVLLLWQFVTYQAIFFIYACMSSAFRSELRKMFTCQRKQAEPALSNEGNSFPSPCAVRRTLRQVKDQREGNPKCISQCEELNGN